jgi:hypothetical protein
MGQKGQSMSFFNWQPYELIETGERFEFRRTSDGKYKRKDGLVLTVPKLTSAYRWIGRNSHKMKQTWVVNHNGFKIREKKTWK